MKAIVECISSYEVSNNSFNENMLDSRQPTFIELPIEDG